MGDGKYNLEMERRKGDEIGEERPERWEEKPTDVEGITKAEEREFQDPKFHKEIDTGTEKIH